jgi:hypothetical protein
MGDSRPDNGGGPPEDGGARPGDLPEFPPEWGTIVIPDDASELEAESTALRKELRRSSRRARLRTLLGLPQPGHDSPSLGVPVVIMAVAVITTLLSLFVVTWDRRSVGQPLPVTSADQSGTGTNASPPIPLSDVTLADSAGTQVRVGSVLPAVVLFTEGCDCAKLITAVAGAMPASVTVLPIARKAPCAAGTAANVHCLADPDGSVTHRFPTASTASGPPDKPSVSAVVINHSGAALPPVTVDSPDDLAPALASI